MVARDTDTRRDQAIYADVLEQLKRRSQIGPTEIGVIVKNGIVTLTGWVDSATKRLAAEDSAHRVHGVVAVANEIEVWQAGVADQTDPEIALAVSHALICEASGPIDRIAVTVSRGWVTLDGEVESQQQKDTAERVARTASGVRGVSNLLVVIPRLSSGDVRADLEHALTHGTGAIAGQIVVEVQGSKVILKGLVNTISKREEAERIAWSIPDVSSVDNEIRVDYAS